MKTRKLLVAAAATIAAVTTCALFSPSASAQYPGPGPTPVFTDNFGHGSTTDGTSTPGGTPTASSTSYDFVSPKPAGDAIVGTGDLNAWMTNTSSAYMECAAVFTSTPVNLQTTGDYIDFILEFTDTANLTIPATQNQLGIGLFNSYGTAPLANNLITGATNTTGGGVQNWTGYSSDLFSKGASGSTSAKILNRGSQTATVGNQDLLFSDTAADTYNGVKGSSLINGTATATAVLTNGVAYTEDFRVTLTGSGQLTVTNTLYLGSGTGGTVLFTYGGYSNSVPSTTFDSLAFGWLEKVNTAPTTQDVSLVEISDSIAVVPEPSTWMLLAAGLAMMVGLVRGRRS
jgi:hypothetical protein